MYLVISLCAFLAFAIALVVAIRRQPHRFERIRRLLCCLGSPLQGYTSVEASVEESVRFVIDDEDEQEIELPIRDKSASMDSTEQTVADTV